MHIYIELYPNFSLNTHKTGFLKKNTYKKTVLVRKRCLCILQTFSAVCPLQEAATPGDLVNIKLHINYFSKYMIQNVQVFSTYHVPRYKIHSECHE